MCKEKLRNHQFIHSLRYRERYNSIVRAREKARVLESLWCLGKVKSKKNPYLL